MPSTKEILEQIIAVAKEYDSELSVLEDVNKNVPKEDLELNERIPHKSGNILRAIIWDTNFHLRRPSMMTLQNLKDGIISNLDAEAQDIQFIMDCHPPIRNKVLGY